MNIPLLHKEAVSKATHLFVSEPDLEMEERISHSDFGDIPKDIVHRACIFTPIAFAHIILEPRGVHFPATYILEEFESGIRERKMFEQELTYLAAWEYAPEFEEIYGGRMFIRVACASAEMSVITQLAQNADNWKGITLTETVVLL